LVSSSNNRVDFPDCLPLKYIDNALIEERIIREKFGYKKMFEDTYNDYVEARKRRHGKIDTESGIKPQKLMTDATSYDVLKQPPYYERFNYVIPAERKPNKNYDDCDEIRRVLDLPYIDDTSIIDKLFSQEKRRSDQNTLEMVSVKSGAYLGKMRYSQNLSR